MSTTNHYIEVINKIKPKNGLTFKLIDGCDIEDILTAPVELDLDEGSSSGTTTTLGSYISDNIVKLGGDITSHIDAKDNPHSVQVAQLDQTGAKSAYNRAFEDNSVNIQMNGAAAVGSLETIARADHVHPTDTTRASQADLKDTQDDLKTTQGVLEVTNNNLSNLKSTFESHVSDFDNHVSVFDKRITDNEAAFEAYKEDTGLTIDGINLNIADLTETVKNNKTEIDTRQNGHEQAANARFGVVEKSIDEIDKTVTNFINTNFQAHVTAQTEQFKLVDDTLEGHAEDIAELGEKVEALTSRIDDEQFLQQQELDNRITTLTVAVEANQEICLTFCDEETTIRVDWGDGNGVISYIIETDDVDSTTISHIYTSKGSYECKIYGMKYLCPTFLTESPAGISATLGLLDAISLNKELNLTKARNNLATFEGCPVKILVPFAELATYESAGLGGNFDAVAHVNDIKSWVLSNLKGWIDAYVISNEATLLEIINDDVAQKIN